MNKIKPVLRLAGSKYRKLNKIINFYKISRCNKFVDLFGGTGIVAVNIKNEFKDDYVILNDYDHLFPLTQEKVKSNLTTYDGLGKYQTNLAKKYFDTRVNNGLWDKVSIYNQIISSIELCHNDYKDVEISNHSFVYLDPPYVNRKYLYKHYIDDNELFDYIQSLPKNVKWLLSYDDNQLIRELYKEYQIIEDEFLYRGLRSKNKIRKELWITNMNVNGL